jgi:opacity protein-like surface antigen
MKKALAAAFTLLVLAIPIACQAAAVRPGPYVSGFIGVSAPLNTDVSYTDFSNSANSSSDRVEFDPSINIGGTGGYDFGYVRLEGELSYKRGEMSTVTSTFVNPPGTVRFTHVDGSLGAIAMLFNCFFDLHNETPVTPYFGGGAGFASLHLSDTTGFPTTGGAPVQLYYSDDDAVFAYQAGAGLEIALNRRLSLDVGYRYFGTSQANFNKNYVTETTLKFESHNAAVGLRVKF